VGDVIKRTVALVREASGMAAKPGIVCSPQENVRTRIAQRFSVLGKHGTSRACMNALMPALACPHFIGPYVFRLLVQQVLVSSCPLNERMNALSHM